MSEKPIRIAIVNQDKCKPKKCKQECKKSCPVVRMGKLCIEVTTQSKIVWISESLCIGCAICIKKCPFGALAIVNLPSNLEKETTHRYCANSFKLHRLPIPRPGEVLGLVGTNGIGKSTALKILAGKQKPNLGKYDAPPDWQEILAYFRGSELQNYFTKILEDDLKAIVKPQYVDQIPKTVKGSIGSILSRKDDTKTEAVVCEQLGVAEKYVRVVQDMYERSRTVVRCAVGQTEEFNVEVGLHQGSALSPFLFAMVMDQLSEEVRQESPWTMMFADDIVICSESREQVEENLERWRFALERRGMKVSRSKTEYMCVNEREGSGTVRLQGEEVKKLQEFKYLGSTVQSNGECGKEVKKRVQAGWNGWRKVSGVLCDRKISARIKGKVYRTVVRPAMLYGLETVSLRKRQESELEVAELKMLRFSLGVTRLDRIRNEYIRGTAHVGRLGDKVREARLRWFGHVQRRENLTHLRDRNVEDLSGGELQRFACAVVCIQRADMYAPEILFIHLSTIHFMFDEPSSYLDVKQRLKAAITIRSLITPDRYIIVVEHDLSVLDYLSDFICCLYGVPSAYGVVTMPFSVREGINIFLDGYVPTENLRFRDASLVFKVAETATEEEVKKMCRYQYPNMKKAMGDFKLQIIEGEFTDSEIMVMLGENGTGKTTFIRLLAGRLKPDNGGEVPILNVSYKPQKISPKFKGSVRALLHEKIRDAYTHPQFVTDVMKPMQIDSIIDQDVQNLSGGELQRVALTLCLGKPADVYLIDEPSAYLDSEQRLMAARVIKRFILHAKKTAFVVEHDFIMATYLADRVIVFDGVPSQRTTANTPQMLLAGMNKFLSLLEITFRRDPNNFRPRINKLNSIKDVEQKRSGNYFFLDD
ncbi:hypothetical protein QTP70_024412 [Hemibagrus guttatus]|uniref:ATP-binding cassette sub-family E member 1 n=1 Tax=Hemibagrus guttatus TaxID=175788 RepID=A0AAE0VDH8_9TELE|nr:hypothetical protein QTP70_024412 [Hemibagrus guttatus]KAK3573158.1 hypothetical protein QTP86_014107 [Hemibagrus guttatus]